MTAISVEPLSSAPPPIWQLDDAIVEFTAEFCRIPQHKISPQTRPIQDLGIDSLDLLDYTFQLEDRFHITLKDPDTKRYFVQDPFTLHHIALMVFHLWGTGTPERKLFFRRIPARPTKMGASTQLGGVPTAHELASGPLLLSLGHGGPRDFYQRKTDGMRCALFPAASALLGSDDPAVPPDERPARRAELSGYLIDAELVSAFAYARFLNAIGPIPDATRLEWCDVTDHRKPCFQLEQINGTWRPIPGTEQHPMVLVSWYGANAYALWANRRDWRMYAGSNQVPDSLRDFPSDQPPPAEFLGSLLPSEAQWEHAARRHAGTSPSVPWAARHLRGQTYTAATMPMQGVCAISKNARSSITHLPGNVWQWCRDFFAPGFPQSVAARSADPQNSVPTTLRAERGGSWVGPSRFATPSYRRARVPIARGRCLGFRCISLTSDLPKAPMGERS